MRNDDLPFPIPADDDKYRLANNLEQSLSAARFYVQQAERHQDNPANLLPALRAADNALERVQDEVNLALMTIGTLVEMAITLKRQRDEAIEERDEAQDEKEIAYQEGIEDGYQQGRNDTVENIYDEGGIYVESDLDAKYDEGWNEGYSTAEGNAAFDADVAEARHGKELHDLEVRLDQTVSLLATAYQVEPDAVRDWLEKQTAQ